MYPPTDAPPRPIRTNGKGYVHHRPVPMGAGVLVPPEKDPHFGPESEERRKAMRQAELDTWWATTCKRSLGRAL